MRLVEYCLTSQVLTVSAISDSTCAAMITSPVNTALVPKKRACQNVPNIQALSIVLNTKCPASIRISVFGSGSC